MKKPTLRIVRAQDEVTPEIGAPCPHPNFELHELGRRVVCGECGVQMDAYAILETWAEWSAKIEDEAGLTTLLAERAERSMHKAHLRALSRRVCFTTEERQEIGRYADKLTPWNDVPIQEVQTYVRQWEKKLRHRGRSSGGAPPI